MKRIFMLLVIFLTACSATATPVAPVEKVCSTNVGGWEGSDYQLIRVCTDTTLPGGLLEAVQQLIAGTGNTVTWTPVANLSAISGYDSRHVTQIDIAADGSVIIFRHTPNTNIPPVITQYEWKDGKLTPK